MGEAWWKGRSQGSSGVTSQTWQGHRNSPSSPSTSTSWSRKSLTREILCSRKGCRGAIHSSLPWPSCWPRFPMLCTAWSKGTGDARVKVTARGKGLCGPRTESQSPGSQSSAQRRRRLTAAAALGNISPSHGQICTPGPLLFCSLLSPGSPSPGLSDPIRHTLEPMRTSQCGHFAKDSLIKEIVRCE